MILYKIPLGFKINGNVLTEDTFFKKYEIKNITDASGVTHNTVIFDRWSISDLSSLGINKIIDNFFDNSRYDLTGNFNDILQDDGTFIRDYTGALTEKSSYIDVLRDYKKNELKISFDSKIEEGYTHDLNGENIKVKCDLESVQSFAFTSENIGKGKSHNRKIKDKHGVIHRGMTDVSISNMFDDIKDYYLKLLDKKFEYEDTINNADRATLDSLTTFYFTV